MLGVVVAGNQRVDRRRKRTRTKRKRMVTAMTMANLKLAHLDLDRFPHDQGPHGDPMFVMILYIDYQVARRPTTIAMPLTR